MISDALSDCSAQLTKDLVWYSRPDFPITYDADTLAEVRNVIKLMNIARIKLDMFPGDPVWVADHIATIEQDEQTYFDESVVRAQAEIADDLIAADANPELIAFKAQLESIH